MRICHKVAKVLGSLIVNHHNKIQFVGYEVANVVLATHEILQEGTTDYGLTYEPYAVVSFLIGSACIWRFDSKRRPSMLFYGGMALTVGGLLLTAAGYSITGLAIALASLETSRGGLLTLQNHVREKLKKQKVVALPTRISLKFAVVILGWYAILIANLSSQSQRLGRFINERPFLTGSFIKAPLRLEFIVKKMVEGDMVGMAVGLSWMILGDGGLAFNDAKLKAFVIEYSQLGSSKNAHSVESENVFSKGKFLKKLQ